MSIPKRYAFVSISGDERIMTRSLKEGERHKFSAFRKPPETWYVNGLISMKEWRDLFSWAIIDVEAQVPLNIGHVRLSHKDTYNRKEGIALAKEKAKDNVEVFTIKQFTYYGKNTMDRQLFSVQLESPNTRMFVDIYENGRPSISTIYKMKDEIHYY